MFGIGMSEMLIICGVALLVFGPTELPQIAKKIARGIREVRKASDDLRKSIDIDEDEPPRRRPPPPPLRSEPERADRELAPTITGSVLTQNADGFDAVDAADSPADDEHDEFGRLRVRPAIATTAGQRDVRNTDEHVPVLQSAQPIGAHNLDDDNDNDNDEQPVAPPAVAEVARG